MDTQGSPSEVVRLTALEIIGKGREGYKQTSKRVQDLGKESGT